MASATVNFAPQAIAKGGAPVQGANPSSSAAGGGPLGVGGQSEGLSFNDLMNGPSTGPPSGEPSSELPKDAASTDDSGGDVPPGGNGLPLVVAMLPPSPQPQQPVTPASEDVLLTTSAQAPKASQTPPLPSLPIPAANPPPVDGEPTVNALLPANPIPATATDGDDAQQALKDALPAQAAPPARAQKQDPTQFKSVQDLLAQKPPPPSGTQADAPASSINAAAVVAAAEKSEGSQADEDASLRRLLASLTTISGDAKSAVNSADGKAAGVNKAADAQAAQPYSLRLANLTEKARLGNEVAVMPAVQQLARELKFERSVDTVAPAPAMTVGLHPAGHTAVASDTPVLQLPTPMANKPEWANGLGDRIVWMTNNNHQNAQIRLNPPHLGPIDVQISVTNDQTNVSLVAHHGTTREALEAAAPRLRELLGSHGLNNVNVNINHQPSGERAAQSQQQQSWQGYGAGEVETAVADTTLPASPRPSTLLDAYA